MNTESITSEVREFIAAKLSTGAIVRVDWMVTEIVANRSQIEGEDTDFYKMCAYGYVKRIAKAVVGKYDAASAHGSKGVQLTLEGFEHLQTGYSVEREGKRLLVPTDQLTDRELLSRAAEYDAMAEGCRLHAREIRDFVMTRQADVAA